MDTDISALEQAVQDYIPQRITQRHVTITWAQSIDGMVSAGSGLRTKLSGEHSHKMTHYLRSKHSAILVGWKTVLSDDPRLNCRYPHAHSTPTPVVLDRKFQWDVISRKWAVLENAARGISKPPIVITEKLGGPMSSVKQEIIQDLGGKVLEVSDIMDWRNIIGALQSQGLESVMIEGGAGVLRTALTAIPDASIIITLAPKFLGARGVHVTPPEGIEMKDVKWWSNSVETMDSVVCGRLSSRN